MQGSDFSDHFSFDQDIELLALEVVRLATSPELIIYSKTKMALSKDQIKCAMGFGKQTHIGVLFYFVGQNGT